VGVRGCLPPHNFTVKRLREHPSFSSSEESFSGKEMLMMQLPALLSTSSSKLRISVLTLRNIDTTSSIISMLKPSKFVLLALVLLNLLLSKLTVELKFLAHNGKLIAFLKSLLTVAPILRD
jgi:hypothetical protein